MVQTPFLTVCISPPGGTQQTFILGGSALTPNPYPFIYHFSRKSYSFRILELMSFVWPFNTLFPTIVSGLLCNWWRISVPGILRSTSYESTHPTLKNWPLGNWLFEQRRLVRSAVKVSLHLPSQIAPLRPVVRSSISRVWFDSWFQAIAPRWGMNALENSF